MGNIGFCDGASFAAQSFEGRPLKVTILSSVPVDKGGSASILKGEFDSLAGRTVVALKVFTTPLDDVQKELLRREVGVARRLQHRFILPFVGTAVVSMQAVLISLFMENGNMMQYLRRKKTPNRRKLVLQIAEAVDHLHTTHGLVHGDLKCENVLISAKGDALLADFGLSTFAEKAQSSTTTLTGIRHKCTIEFAAPELLVDRVYQDGGRETRLRSKTTQTDVYAFGMLVLQAFTGRPPWPGSDIIAIIYRVASGAIHPHPGEGAVSLGLTGPWWQTCLMCWAFEPYMRLSIREVWNALRDSMQEECRVLRGHRGPVMSVVYTPCGERLVSCSWDRTIRVWDISSGDTIVGPIIGHGDIVCCIAVSSDGQRIVSTSADATVRIWDANTGCPLVIVQTDRTEVFTNSVAYSPDGTRVVVGSFSAALYSWDVLTGEPSEPPLKAHSGAVWAVAYSPDGTLIASGSADCTVRIWRAGTGKPLWEMIGHEGQVETLCFSPDSTRLASGACDSTVRVWDTATGQLERTLIGHSKAITSVAFSPSGCLIASGSFDRSVRIWEAGSGKLLRRPLMGHEHFVHSVAFSPDGKDIVTGSRDETIRIWRVPSPREDV